MVAETLAALASAGGAAVAGAMATDAWRATRDGIAGLFDRWGGPRHQAVVAELDRDAQLLSAVGDDGRAPLRQELTNRWRQRLADLFDDEPSAAAELRDLLAAAAHPAGSTVLVQRNVARDNSRIFAVQDGTIHYHEPAAGSATDPDEAG